jgi:hypothetical protein
MTTIMTDGRPTRPMHHWLACAMIASAVSFAGATSAAAQAGSTGGSIGKQEKSVSGDTAPAAPEVSRPAKSRKESRRESRRESRSRPSEAAASGGCRSIAGTWTSWASRLYGRGDTRINADGTLWHKSSRGTWTCNGGIYHHTWDSFGVRGPYKLSGDGRRLIKITDGSTSFSR